MWQFIPETAVKYGMHLGPLVDMARPDTLDDRHHYERETVAAAHYLKDLYGSDAQGSGLLVMACYNWGEDYVLPLVRSMPLNPKDRNFWMLLQKHRKRPVFPSGTGWGVSSTMSSWLMQKKSGVGFADIGRYRRSAGSQS
jgi:hypothetical protein